MTAAAPPQHGASGHDRMAFASVEVFRDPRAALADWRALSPEACASFYQTETFLLTWLDRFGASKGVTPFLIVARDASGAAVALLPLGLYRFGSLRVAEFLGGKHSNYNLGLFRADSSFSAGELRRLLKEAARKAPDGPHLYRLLNMPLRWRGDNPLALLPHRESASHAYATELGVEGEAWLAARLSSDTRKKLRKKEKRLADLGALRYFRAADRIEAERILDAFFEQKRRRFNEPAHDRESRTLRGFYEALTAPDGSGAPARVELHALALGERIVATLAAGLNGGRLQGMFNSFDADPDIARSSPGDILLTYVLRDGCARKLRAFDLGVGDARYKATFCDTIETMVDVLHPASAAGRLALPFFAAAQAAKRAIKRNPRLYAAAMKLRRV